jgi:predicted phage terminase large subunit-like protein
MACSRIKSFDFWKQPRSQNPNPSQTKPFDQWLQEVTPRWTWDWPYQQYIYERLDALTRGAIKRLMIFLPPRHGKTELATVRYSVWRLCRDPALRVLIAAYNQTIAEGFSRKCRRLAFSLGLLSPGDRRSVGEWDTYAGGSLTAAGVGAGVTGKGFGLIWVDDPIRGHEEANSQTYRDRVWDWYLNDLYTRLEPDAGMGLILTRWNEDDLAGRILASEDAPNWMVVKLPAIAEEDDPLGREVGEALCPARFDRAALDQIHSVQGSYPFSALYQQSPQPGEGGRFKRSWFRYFREDTEFYTLDRAALGTDKFSKEQCWRFMTLDPAATEKEQSDWFVCSTWAVTPKRDLLLLHVLRERADTTKHEGILKPLLERHKPSLIGVEAVSFGLNIIQRLRALGYPVISLKADKDKVSRSLPMAARYEAGLVFHPATALWVEGCEDELLHFPTGKYDDFVDTASYAGVVLLTYGPYQAPLVDEIAVDRTLRSIKVLRAMIESKETEEYL